MEIIRTDLNERLEHNQKNKEFIREITSRVYSVCEETNFFKSKKERVLRITSKQKKLQERLDKLTSLLEKASRIKKDLVKKDTELESYVFETKRKLLKMLGSEL